MSTATLERTAKAESIDQDLAGIAHKALQAYVTTLVRVARGESLPASEIQTACVSYGRSIPQFQADVPKVRQRLAAIKQLDDMNTMRAETQRANAEQAKADAAIKQLDADYTQRRAALAQEYVRACAAYQSAASTESWAQSNALGILRNTAGDPHGDLKDPGNVKLS
jgi:hypothetical protein